MALLIRSILMQQHNLVITSYQQTISALYKQWKHRWKMANESLLTGQNQNMALKIGQGLYTI